jgi:hypothetical protein
MSGSVKAAVVDFPAFSRHMITFIDDYRDRFWGETGAAFIRKPRAIVPIRFADFFSLTITTDGWN